MVGTLMFPSLLIIDKVLNEESSRGKYRKKHLTGNSYYAAKAKKNFYYQDMGKKGGRPRIYNRIESMKDLMVPTKHSKICDNCHGNGYLNVVDHQEPNPGQTMLGL